MFKLQSYYSREELIVLILVVVLGAGRTTLTKIYFQMGYDDPFFVTCLVLAGHSLALPSYFLCQKIGYFQPRHDQKEEEQPQSVQSTIAADNRSIMLKEQRARFGSATGLGVDSSQAVQWVHRLPFYTKPLITSIFGLMDAVFRVSSVFFLPASIADMLVTGLELFFIIVAQKYIRRRTILPQRWVGSAIVIAGLVVVTSADYTADSQMQVKSLGLGLICVMMKVVSGVALDMSQELFTQEADIPAIQLLGMEATYGLLLFIPIYTLAAPLTGFHPLDALRQAASSTQAATFTVGLLFMLYIAGIFQILGTSVTSSMTRNLWITSFRGPTVWVIALLVYYCGAGDNEPSLGEEWYSPGSWMILAGVVVISIGVRIYYSNIQPRNQTEDSSGGKTGMNECSQTQDTTELENNASSSDIWCPPLGNIEAEIEV